MKADRRPMGAMIVAVVMAIGISVISQTTGNAGAPSSGGRQVIWLLYCNWGLYGSCFPALFYEEQVTVVAEIGQLNVYGNGAWGYGDCPECEIAVRGEGPAPEPIEGGGGSGVCPVPTNFREVSADDIGSGSLRFEYAWDSSTGTLEDIAGCEIGEYVDQYTSNPFPSPPFKAALSPNDPTESIDSAVSGHFEDVHLTPGPFVRPFEEALVDSTQIYRFRCPCQAGNAWQTLMGPHRIRRVVTMWEDWVFWVAKTGSRAFMELGQE